MKIKGNLDVRGGDILVDGRNVLDRDLFYINDLEDVSAESPANNQSLVYNSTSGKWEPTTISGGGSGPTGDFYLNDLKDVSAASPDNEDLLVYDDNTGLWTARNLTVNAVGKTQNFYNLAAWEFNHNFNSTNLIWSTFNDAQRFIQPDQVDFSDPDTAFFYFSSILPEGKAVLVPATLNSPGQYILIRDEKAAGTAGGTFTAGAWRTRDLNTIVTDETGEVTLSSNAFTIPAGTYEVLAYAPALFVRVHRARLQNTTDGSTTLLGSNAFTPDDPVSNPDNRSFVSGKFTITASKTFELQHRAEQTQATAGFGVGFDLGVVEVYTVVELIKVA